MKKIVINCLRELICWIKKEEEDTFSVWSGDNELFKLKSVADIEIPQNVPQTVLDELERPEVLGESEADIADFLKAILEASAAAKSEFFFMDKNEGVLNQLLPYHNIIDVEGDERLFYDMGEGRFYCFEIIK